MKLNSLLIICIISLHIFFSCNNKSNVGSDPSEELIEIDTLIPEIKVLISQKETAVANLISGKDKSFFDSIITISDDYWNDFSSKIDNDFEKIYNDRLVHMSDWSNTDFISNSIDTSLVLYPFSGPDFLHVNYLYPNANEYILLAREKVGSFPDWKEIDQNLAEDFLDNTTYFLRDVTLKSFFLTNNMKSDIEEKSKIPGVVSSLYWLLSRTGHQIVSMKYVTINEGGKVIERSGETKLDGVQINFIKAGTENIKKVTYFSCDISDGGFSKRNPELLKYLNNIRDCNTYVKAASYLMHYSFFSEIRNLVLEKSMTIFQDDTGIPYRYVNNDSWSVRHFGSYVKPVSNFAEDYDILYQKDLIDLYKNNEPEKLPFSLGYHWISDYQNQMFMIKEK
ncbi:MAG: hypothetical protein HOA52_04930 [Flavobacteriales bacterium]|jgi:hypothetical protein|nr:hypothetical protein [Flavobacteriales bacterium]